MTTTYSASDPAQQQFLAALRGGETGSASNAYSEGTGGADLSGSATDYFGFPLWSGAGTSHAAGAYQFQPATWDQVAQQHGLNFGSPADQDAGAWYEAQSAYATATGGGDLEGALQAGNVSAVQSALAKVWPSITSSAFAQAFTGGSGGTGTADTGTGSATSSGDSSTPSNPLSGDFWLSLFQRFGLVILGGLVVVIALWALLARQGVVPGPADTAKAIGHAAVLAAA